MAIFNSYVTNYQRVYIYLWFLLHKTSIDFGEIPIFQPRWDHFQDIAIWDPGGYNRSSMAVAHKGGAQDHQEFLMPKRIDPCNDFLHTHGEAWFQWRMTKHHFFETLEITSQNGCVQEFKWNKFIV